MQVNFNGVVNCAHAIVSRMKLRGRGRIILVSTFAGNAPIAGSSADSASKGAARLFMKFLHAETRDRFPDIDIVEWIPVALNTGMGIAEGSIPWSLPRRGRSSRRSRDRCLTD